MIQRKFLSMTNSVNFYRNPFLRGLGAAGDASVTADDWMFMIEVVEKSGFLARLDALNERK
jgi:hypothetical protein